jgi:hypothetical protein
MQKNISTTESDKSKIDNIVKIFFDIFTNTNQQHRTAVFKISKERLFKWHLF